MRQLSFQIYGRFLLLRGVLLIGVFAGLLFSSAEGIRLLPFPQQQQCAATGEIGFSRNLEEKILYQKNLHRFETRQEKQSKVQREAPPRADIYHGLTDSPFSPLSILLEINFPAGGRRPAKAFENIRSAGGGSRAPPVSEAL
jgi:hypothetical protein